MVDNKINNLKITIDQLKNYLRTGLKFELQLDCHEDFGDLEDCKDFQKAFSKGALWEFVGWSDINLLLGEGEFNDELLQYEKGIYKGNYNDSKPLFYRLSDLDKFIEELGFVPIERAGVIIHSSLAFSNEDVREWYKDKLKNSSEINYNQMNFQFVSLLFQWHFWVFDQECFEQGLIIDKMNYK